MSACWELYKKVAIYCGCLELFRNEEVFREELSRLNKEHLFQGLSQLSLSVDYDPALKASDIHGMIYKRKEQPTKRTKRKPLQMQENEPEFVIDLPQNVNHQTIELASTNSQNAAKLNEKAEDEPIPEFNLDQPFPQQSTLEPEEVVGGAKLRTRKRRIK